MNEWLKEMTGTNLAIIFLGLTLLVCAISLFITDNSGLGLEGIKIIGAGLIGYATGKESTK